MSKQSNLLFNYFKPSIYVRSIRDINVNQLKRQGIKLVVCDLDNTLVPYYGKLPTKEVMELIRKVKDADMEFIIMSNNLKNRVTTFALKAKVDCYYASRKPFKHNARKIMNRFKDLTPSQIVMIGDQIILDILVANRMRWESILVQPIVATDYKMSWFKIFVEEKVYKILEKQNILKRGEFMEGKLGQTFEIL